METIDLIKNEQYALDNIDSLARNIVAVANMNSTDFRQICRDIKSQASYMKRLSVSINKARAEQRQNSRSRKMPIRVEVFGVEELNQSNTGTLISNRSSIEVISPSIDTNPLLGDNSRNQIFDKSSYVKTSIKMFLNQYFEENSEKLDSLNNGEFNISKFFKNLGEESRRNSESLERIYRDMYGSSR